jgi:hypothetical protein
VKLLKRLLFLPYEKDYHLSSFLFQFMVQSKE